jgi:mRNA-degrading endonuclease RelE of RelBE toxin-antitoxin system
VKLYFHPEAEKELLQMDKPQQNLIRSKVEKFKEEGMNCDCFGRLTSENPALNCYRLKIKQEESPEINYRLIIDVYEGQFVAFGLNHREEVYSEDYLKEISSRKY